MSFDREIECWGKCLHIKQLYIGDVGCVVWDAALVLTKFLENPKYFPTPTQISDGVKDNDTTFWREKKVVDVGSGTGVTGLAAAVLGANVIISDLPDFMELMSANIEANSGVVSGTISPRTLKWGEEISSDILHPETDIILMSDVVYYEESLEALHETLLKLCHENTRIIMSYEERTTGNKSDIEKKFFQMMTKKFRKTVIPFEHLDKTFRSPDIHIIIFDLLSS